MHIYNCARYDALTEVLLSILECYTFDWVKISNIFSNVLFSRSRIKHYKEDESRTFLQNIRNHSPNDEA
jgi:hypothetical protein